MQFEELVAVSEQLAAHRSRSKKSELLCACLRTLSERELPVAVKYLCGDLPQGKIGIGYAAIRKVLSDLPADYRQPLHREARFARSVGPRHSDFEPMLRPPRQLNACGVPWTCLAHSATCNLTLDLLTVRRFNSLERR